MLGRLIQTAASYGKGNPSLESATEEAHTRNLLYGQSQHVYSLAQSPPTSPFTGPAFRPGSFDDRGGLELEEKELRILIAQDAFGTEEKPTILLDSNVITNSTHSTPSHTRHASTVQAGPRSPLPNDWRPGTPLSPNPMSIDPGLPFRSRSSTVSGAPSGWTRPVRDAGTREEAFLECMFGVIGSTKTASTTKMHIVPGKAKLPNQGAHRTTTNSDTTEQQTRRSPLLRSRTSGIATRIGQPSVSGLDIEPASQDAVLITRLFNVALPDAIAPTPVGQVETSVSGPSDLGHEQLNSPTSPNASGAHAKKPKLVERKVPTFAIGLILYLPRGVENRASSNRPSSRSAYAHNLSSASSSYGSDLQNSWTFLNAIPESLASSKSHDEADRRIEVVVNNWDVILRAITSLERDATAILFEQLDQILNQVTGPIPKTPKEKSMQRINQRIISITDPATISRRPSLQRAVRHMISRVCYALRIPRVITGLGFAAGHWSDEARMLHRICGRRQQNFFLFNLLTAFLGNHTQWLQRLAPEWYRKQYRSSNRQRGESHLLSQRTVIISDQRSIARRLIFILASFIPGIPALDGLHKPGDDFHMATNFSASSPSSHLARNESLRRAANRRMRDHRLQSGPNEKALLSTSASSVESLGTTPGGKGSQRYMTRKDSDCASMFSPTRLPVPDSDVHFRKTSAGTTSTITPNPTTPIAYFATRRDSYFPEGVIAETSESLASADLANLLRRSSSGVNSGNVSSRWGSLMSGISDLWSARDNHPVIPSSTSTGQNIGSNRHIPANSSKAPAGSTRKTDEINTRGPSSARTSDPRMQNSSLDSPAQQTDALRILATAPLMKVDDKDGVVDVDLDLPGFTKFHNEDGVMSPPRRSHRPSIASGYDGAESIRSLRSLPAASPKVPSNDEVSTAGYLKRYHEDFALHATRPYAELETDIRRSMSRVASPPNDQVHQVHSDHTDEWINVCTTVVADVRTFSLRRITLRRRVTDKEEMTRDVNSPTSSSLSAKTGKPARKSTFNQAEEEFIEEDIRDFDTTLADAVERVLNLVDAAQPPGMGSPRNGHSRAASTSNSLTARSTPPGARVADFNFVHVSQEYARQDCRQMIMGALEEVVREESDELGKLQKGRDIRVRHNIDVPAVKVDNKQENILREGVKGWLLSLEQTKV